MRYFLSWPLLLCLLALVPKPAGAADNFQLQDGDRVVLVGNTLIEREQNYGYWETLLTSRYPDRKIAFRNVGWSGDTVFGEARAGFGTLADGFQHLKEEVLAAKPTVILVGYGGNEAFAGEAGLPHFVEGLNVLLDTLAQTRARIVLLSPLPEEDLGRPLPDPTEHNRVLKLYCDAMHQVAEKRGYRFLDFYSLLGNNQVRPVAPLTDDGLHLTAWGYWESAKALAQGLGLALPRWRIEMDQEGKTSLVEGAKVETFRTGPLRFRVTDSLLPPPRSPKNSLVPGSILVERALRIRGLAPGKYALHIDGKPVALGSAEEWAAGVMLTAGPEYDQVEQLRAAIIDKNRLYFRRWRPENETYLYGFRKHEQGQNAREIPQFDPLVTQAEAAIARLRVPAAHEYELVPEVK